MFQVIIIDDHRLRSRCMAEALTGARVATLEWSGRDFQFRLGDREWMWTRNPWPPLAGLLGAREGKCHVVMDKELRGECAFDILAQANRFDRRVEAIVVSGSIGPPDRAAAENCPGCNAILHVLPDHAPDAPGMRALLRKVDKWRRCAPDAYAFETMRELLVDGPETECP